jgi:hypothetical protein
LVHHDLKADGEGFDAIAVSGQMERGLGQAPPASAAKCAASSTEANSIPPDLAIVIGAWLHLPTDVRKQILAIIRIASAAAQRGSAGLGHPGFRGQRGDLGDQGSAGS